MKRDRLFQLKNNHLSEIEQIGGKKVEKNEKILQTLIEKNLDIIFPSLEFLSSEFQIDKLRPDTVAFDKERYSFVIIEYKNVKHKGVVDQGITYRRKLIEKIDAFILLYHSVKGIILDKVRVQDYLDETRVIFISPEFNEFQRGAIEDEIASNIELYEVVRYDDGILLLEKLGSENAIKQRTKQQFLKLDEYSEEDYLAGKYFRTTKPNETAKKLFVKLKSQILDMFPDLEFKQMKKYAGFYSNKDGSGICTIESKTSKLNLCYATSKINIIPKSTFVRHMVRTSGKKIGHFGLGDYMSQISNESDIQKALPLIEKIYNLKVK